MNTKSMAWELPVTNTKQRVRALMPISSEHAKGNAMIQSTFLKINKVFVERPTVTQTYTCTKAVMYVYVAYWDLLSRTPDGVGYKEYTSRFIGNF